MINKDKKYKKIMSQLFPLWDELTKIENELKLIWEFDFVEGEPASDYENNLDEKACKLRQEIAFLETELEEIK